MSRYSAFISYSHADTPVARRLHRALETYRVPRKLVGAETALGPATRRLAPVFRDRDDLPASGDLGGELRAALADTAFQIVLCSPAAARSHWVNEEILAFKRVHGDARVLALIVDGEPGDPSRECFPPALRFHMGHQGVLTTEPAEPIAADIRPGGDGRRLASLKIIAGLTGLKLDALVRRDAARRQRRLAYIASGAVAVAAVTLLLALYAVRQRIEADHQRVVAEAQRRTAEASLDFLIGTFQIANPATENPRTITAITLIHRVSDRVKTELRGQPAVSARLLRATGDIYYNLGLMKESERDFAVALAREPAFGETRATTLARLSRVVRRAGDLKRAARLIDQAERAYDPRLTSALPVTALIIEERAQLAQLDAKPEHAVQLFERASTIYARLGSEQAVGLARTLKDEGLALINMKAYARADTVLARAEALHIRLYGPDHLKTANVVQNRALNALNAGRLTEAQQLIARAVTVYERVLEPDHPENANVALLQGRIAHAAHKLSEAATALTKAASLDEHLFGPTNYTTGDANFYLAEVLSDRGAYVDALTALARTKNAYDASYGRDDPDQIELLDKRAQVLRAAGRPVDSARDCTAAIAMRVRLNPRDPELDAAKARCRALAANPPGISLRFH